MKRLRLTALFRMLARQHQCDVDSWTLAVSRAKASLRFSHFEFSKHAILTILKSYQ